MSIPVSECMFLRAAREGGLFRRRFMEIMTYNVHHGSMAVRPCTCKPPCTATGAQAIDLENEIKAIKKSGRKDVIGESIAEVRKRRQHG